MPSLMWDVIIIDGQEFVLPEGLPFRDADDPRRHHAPYRADALEKVADALVPNWKRYTVYTYTPLCGAIRG
jgi:hypothetical protein